MEKKDFYYIENMIWVKKQVNNKLAEEKYDYFRKSKLSLLIFRRTSGESVELRHQRNPDVYFDFVRRRETLSDDIESEFSSGNRESKPFFVYHLIETLLPTGNFNPSTGHGKFLHLWSDLNYSRKGWTTVFNK